MHQEVSRHWRASLHLLGQQTGFHLRWLPFHLEVLAELQVIVTATAEDTATGYLASSDIILC